MKIPPKVKIGPHMFDLVLVEVVNKYSPRRAEIDLLSNTIKIDRNMAHSRQCEALFHEALHDLADGLAIPLSEDEVARLGRGFYAFLRDNDLLK